MTEKNKKQNRINFKFILFLALVILLGGLYVEAKILSIKRLKIQKVTLSDEKISPSFNKTKILVFSDVRGDVDQLDKVVENVSSNKPDFIVFLGNLYGDDLEEQDFITKKLEDMDAPLGKYAILSKEDYQQNLEQTKESLSKAEFRLQDTNLISVFNKTSDPINFLFVDYDGAGVSSVDEVISRIQEDQFVIGFSHNAKQIEQDNKGVHTLVSSKHQYSKVNVPYLRQLIYEDAYIKNYEKINDVHLYLTTGISTSDPKFRILSNPDILLITLKSSQ